MMSLNANRSIYKSEERYKLQVSSNSLVVIFLPLNTNIPVHWMS